MYTLFVVLSLVVGAGFYFKKTYDRLIAQIETVYNSQKQVDIRLSRRFKVFELLVEAAEAHNIDAQDALKNTVMLHFQGKAHAQKGNFEGQIEAENAISKLVNNFLARLDTHLDLREDAGITYLCGEMASNEDKLICSKQVYNAALELFNHRKQTFPERYFITLFARQLDKVFVYWTNTPKVFTS